MNREELRLQALYHLNLLDTPADESFDCITRMAGRIFDLPIALISFTDRNRQWFKSRVGMDHDCIDREEAPCAEVAETAAPLVIPDLLDHPRYATNRVAKAGIRFYAGAPLVTRDGHGLGALCVLGPEPRQASASELAALSDLAAMVMSQIELQYAFGRTEPLTGLPNRNRFQEDMIDLARDHPGERRMAVMIDLARPEEINSITRAIGTARIDDMVNEASAVIQGLLGPGRRLYHVAATQFLFLSALHIDELSYVAMLEQGFLEGRRTSSVRFVTTVALGVMPFVLGILSPAAVLHGAYGAAQDARHTDGAISVYSSSNDEAYRRRFRLLEDFGKAFDDPSQLRLVYQPRVDLRTGACLGAEALLRWRHPVLGDIRPDEFIPVIEQTSLARALTAWVVDRALSQASAWAADGHDLALSVNISANNLIEEGFVGHIALLLRKHGIRPERLELELTETAVMEHGERALIRLRALRDLGVRLAIDDFGTGYSSLSYLQKLPVTVVKIDRSFVTALTTDSVREQALVDMMVTLSQRIGCRTVAEGVETGEVAKILTRMGCEEAQGYFFARALESDDFLRWLARNDRPAHPVLRVA